MSYWGSGILTEKKLIWKLQSSSRSPEGEGTLIPEFLVLSGFQNSPIVALVLLGSIRVNLLMLEILFCSRVRAVMNTNSPQPGSQVCVKGRMVTSTLPPWSTGEKLE